MSQDDDPNELTEWLQQSISGAVQRHGVSCVKQLLLPLAFPGGTFEVDLFCATHGFQPIWDGQDLMILGAAPNVVVTAPEHLP